MRHLAMLRPSAGAGIPELYTSLVPAQIATLLEAADDTAVRAALTAYRAILVGRDSRCRSRFASVRPT